MKYKIYITKENGFITNGVITTLLLDDDFKDEEFNSVEDAFEAIKEKGSKYCHYTVLPYIYLTD